MSDEQFDNLIDLYAAGELDPNARATVERYLGEHPERREELEAARARLAALEAGLARFKVSDGFAERAMARIRLEADRMLPQPLPERWHHRALRYAATAAAAVLFAFAGYGMIRRAPAGRVGEGHAVRLGTENAPLATGTPLTVGDVVATPPVPKTFTRLSLASGRLHAALAPGSRLEICDARQGSVARLEQGGLFWLAQSDVGAPVIESPLAKIAAISGVLSLHVTPSSARSEEPGRFQGTVVMAAHQGWGRVFLPGGRQGVLTLQRGQVLTLRTGPGNRTAEPLPAEAIAEQYQERVRQLTTHLATLDRQWREVSEAVRHVAVEEHPKLFIQAVTIQAQMARIGAVRDEFQERLDLLERCREQGQQVFNGEGPATPDE